MRLRFTIGLLILKIVGKFPVDTISLSLNFDQRGPFGDSHLEYDKIGIFVALEHGLSILERWRESNVSGLIFQGCSDVNVIFLSKLIAEIIS